MFDQKSLKLFEAYDRQTLASGSPMSLAGALLRAPGQLLRDIGAGERAGERASALLLVTAVFCAGYGAVLGLFSGGMQPLLAAAKLPIIVVGSALLCTPTLYVFNALSGSRLTYLQTVSLALLMAAALALMLVAFAPIVWFFGVSTEGSAFMRTLHLAVFAVAAGFGLRTLNVAGAPCWGPASTSSGRSWSSWSACRWRGGSVRSSRRARSTRVSGACSWTSCSECSFRFGFRPGRRCEPIVRT
jgi:hypothetical protein